MGKLDTETRSRILSEISRNISNPDVYNSWFDNISFQGEDGNRLKICLQNSTQAKYFRNRFQSVIKKAAAQALGQDVELVISGESEGDTESSSLSNGQAGSARGNGTGPAENLTKSKMISAPVSTVKRNSSNTDEQRSGGNDTADPETQKDQFRKKLNLRENFTFENFVVGPCNRLAHSAARAVCEQPGNAYNPLFLHGDVGLGKTHLLQAICNHYIEDHVANEESPSILYLPCETFVNKYVNGIMEQSIDEFRNRIRNLDLLVIDDIHFLSDKQGSQEEFFHTFNALHNARSQIVLSSDCHPRDLPNIQKRVMSRFKWGLTTRLESPSWETALAIIKKKFQQSNVEVETGVMKYIAHNFSESVREMEGAISKISAFSKLGPGDNLNLAKTRKLLGETSTSLNNGSVTVQKIQKKTADFFGVKREKLVQDNRDQSVSHARHVAIYLSRQLTNHSLKEIGSFFGGKNHSTIHYAIKKIEEKLQNNRKFRARIDHLKEKVQSG